MTQSPFVSPAVVRSKIKLGRIAAATLRATGMDLNADAVDELVELAEKLLAEMEVRDALMAKGPEA